MSKFLTLSLLLCTLWAKAPYQSFYDTKLEEFETMRPTDLVFLGDSLTMRNNWSDFKASNMGIDGDTTAGILSRMHLAFQAESVVLMIGVNDILNETALVRIQGNYMKILKKFPSSQKVYILSLLPVIDNVQTRKINQEIKTMNRWLEQQTEAQGFEFIDLYPAFLDANKKGLKKEFTTDGIHLTSKAYRVWSALLKQRLR